jgi:hypothetical protein
LKAVAGGRAGDLRMGGERVKKTRRRPTALVNTRPLCCKSFRVEEAYWTHNLTGHVFGSCWVCQRMRTHSGRVITVGLVRSVISALGS